MDFYFIILAFYLLGLKSYYQALLKQIADNFSKKLCNFLLQKFSKTKTASTKKYHLYHFISLMEKPIIRPFTDKRLPREL